MLKVPELFSDVQLPMTIQSVTVTMCYHMIHRATPTRQWNNWTIMFWPIVPSLWPCPTLPVRVVLVTGLLLTNRESPQWKLQWKPHNHHKKQIQQWMSGNCVAWNTNIHPWTSRTRKSRSAISLVPRSVAKKPDSMANQETNVKEGEEPPKAMSNDDFRKLLGKWP